MTDPKQSVWQEFPRNARAAQMRERAATFEQMADDARDPVIHAELKRLAVLYVAQAERIERGEESPPDPGEGG